jgi:hypothetical protein
MDAQWGLLGRGPRSPGICNGVGRLARQIGAHGGLAWQTERRSNNRLQWTGTLKVSQASKVLFRLKPFAREVPAH